MLRCISLVPPAMEMFRARSQAWAAARPPRSVPARPSSVQITPSAPATVTPISPRRRRVEAQAQFQQRAPFALEGPGAHPDRDTITGVRGGPLGDIRLGDELAGGGVVDPAGEPGVADQVLHAVAAVADAAPFVSAPQPETVAHASGRVALVEEQGVGDGPAVVLLANEVLEGEYDVVEVFLEEVGGPPVYPDDGSDGHFRVLQGHGQHRETLMFRNFPVGPGQAHSVVGLACTRAPHFRSVDHPGLAVADRPGHGPGHVRTPGGLREQLDPYLLAAEDPRQVPPFEDLRPMIEQGDAQHADRYKQRGRDDVALDFLGPVTSGRPTRDHGRRTRHGTAIPAKPASKISACRALASAIDNERGWSGSAAERLPWMNARARARNDSRLSGLSGSWEVVMVVMNRSSESEQ